MKPFEDSHGFVTEFFVIKAFFETLQGISKVVLMIFLDSLEHSLPATQEIGFMKRYLLEEIVGRLNGTWTQKPKIETIPEAIKRIYNPEIYRSSLPQYEDNLNGRFVDPTSGCVNPSRVPSLKESVDKLKQILEGIKAHAAPDSRESKLPLTAPLLKLALLEDTLDVGEVNEDLLVRIYEEALTNINAPELYQIVALGRKGKVVERRIDYMQMLESVERLFVQNSSNLNIT